MGIFYIKLADQKNSNSFIASQWTQKYGQRAPRIDEIINGFLKVNEMRLRKQERRVGKQYVEKMILQ